MSSNNDLVKKLRKMFPTSAVDAEKTGYDHLLQASEDGSARFSDDSDSTLHLQSQTKSKHTKAKKYSTWIAKLVLIGFAIWGIMNIGRRTISVTISKGNPNEPRSCSCGGTTVAEAKRRGCIFTPLAIAWLPPHCIDQELADDFDKAGPGGKWEYWADVNATIPMTREQVGELANTWGAVFYTTQEWHIMHCMYTWRKHYRKKFTGTTIENRSNGIDHIKHCTTIVRDRAPLLKIWTKAGIELNADLV